MDGKLSVVVADDNERILSLLSDLLSSDEEINVVGTAANGQEAYEMIRKEKPDVVLLDIIMPKLDGLSVMEKINKDSTLDKHPAFVVMSAVGQEAITEDAFSLGANYYIMKPFDSKELVARVKAVLRRFQPVKAEALSTDQKCVEYPELTINLTNYSVTYEGRQIDMPPKELELLYFLASSPNQVFTREQLLDNIWGYEYIGDTRTEDVHVKRLREKIKDKENWSISTVWGIGYKFEVTE